MDSGTAGRPSAPVRVVVQLVATGKPCTTRSPSHRMHWQWIDAPPYAAAHFELTFTNARTGVPLAAHAPLGLRSAARGFSGSSPLSERGSVFYSFGFGRYFLSIQSPGYREELIELIAAEHDSLVQATIPLTARGE